MKPLTLEEAEANIGKEVYLLPHTKPYGFTLCDGTHKSENLNYNNIIGKKLILVSLDDEFDVNVRPFDCNKAGSLEVIAMRHISLAEPLKIGDTVKLDPSTMPYTWASGEELQGIYVEELARLEEHKVLGFYEGNVALSNHGFGDGIGVAPRHLIKVEGETMKNINIGSTDESLATHIGKHSKVKSYVSEKGENFLWLNNRWIDGNIYGETYEPLTIGIDTEKFEFKKPQYTPKEVELRERIAFKLLEQRSSDQSKIGEKTDLIFKIITGK